jgi:hypothetical protein
MLNECMLNECMMKHIILIVLVASVILCVATLSVGSSAWLDFRSTEMMAVESMFLVEESPTNRTGQQGHEQPITTNAISRSTSVEVNMINNNVRPVSAEVLIMVLSARGNFDRRAAIREIWATDDVYFVVGSRCHVPRANAHSGCEDGDTTTTGIIANSTFQAEMDREEEVLSRERDEFRDIIISPVPESYLSLTNKLKTAYRFALLEEHNSVQWIVKADDDFYANVKRLQTFIMHYNSSALHVIGCLVWCCAPVRAAGKNADTVYQRGKGNYPWFPRGSCGHGVSIALAKRLLESGDLKEYPGEDTSLGIWIQQSTFRRDVVWIRAYEEQGPKKWLFNKMKKDESGHGGNQWLDAEARFSANDYCDNPQHLMMGHGITPAKMRECHESRNAT